jgi:integrase
MWDGYMRDLPSNIRRRERRGAMTVRFNTQYWGKLKHLNPATTEEIRSFLGARYDTRSAQVAQSLARIVANTGLRRRELTDLKISDVDFDKGWIVVQQQSVHGPCRWLPIRQKTNMAIRLLHTLNPHSIYVLGEHPRTRFDQTLRTLRRTPQLKRGRLWLHVFRANFIYRLMSVRITNDIVRYCLGHQSLDTCLYGLSLTHEQKLLVIRRSVERFLDEL